MARIAIVARTARGTTGQVRLVLDQARHLNSEGHEVAVVSERSTKDLPDNGFKSITIKCPWWQRYRRRERFLQRANKVVNENYDLIVGHGDLLHQDVVHIHNCVHYHSELINRSPLSPSDKIGRFHRKIFTEGSFRRLIANSQMMKNDLCSRWSLNPDKVEVVNPGFDEQLFNPENIREMKSAARSRLGIKDGTVAMGIVTSGGFLTRGVGTLLQAYALLPGRHKEKTCLVIAGSDDRRPWKHMEWYSILDVYVNVGHDSFGMAAQEAMACGVTTILGNAVGAAELLPSEFLKIPSFDPLILATRLKSLTDDAQRRAQLGEDCSRAVAHNTWTQCRTSTSKIYESVIQE